MKDRHPHSNRRQAGIAVLLLLLMLPGMAASGADPTRSVSTLPFLSVSGDPRVYVTLKLNDAKSLTFLVDTGAYLSTITSTAAKQMGLTPKPGMLGGKPLLVLGKPVDQVRVKVSLGTFNFLDMPFVVVDPQSLQPAAGKSVNGLLGTNLLQYLTVLLDFSGRDVRFWYPAGLSDAEMKSLGFTHPWTIPVDDPTHGNLFWTQVKFSNKGHQVSRRLTIDTGSTTTSVPPAVAQQLQLEAFRSGTYTTLLGAETGFQADVGTAQVGDLTLSNFTVSYPAQEDYTHQYGIGVDVLGKHKVLLDFSQKKVYLQLPDLVVHIKPSAAEPPAVQPPIVTPPAPAAR